MGVDKAQTAEAARSPAEPPDFRQLNVSCIPQNHIAHDPVTGKQNADLPPEIAGESGKMPRQLRGNDLPGGNASAEGPFQSAFLGLFDS
jgi:hypothetical protein